MVQQRLEVVPGIGPRHLHHVLGRAGGDDLAALVAAFGAEVDDPVGGLDDLQIMFDHVHGVALLDQDLEHLQQLAHVLEIEAGGGPVEDVEAPAADSADVLFRAAFGVKEAAQSLVRS